MPKRKNDAAHSKQDNDLEALPIPIQSYLWRQLSPFVRPYNRKLQETSCVSFERVVVQNILHGLSPSLSDAIQSIPRWRFVVASLPYVIHCCVASLESRPHWHHSTQASAAAAAAGDPEGVPPPPPAVSQAPPLGPNATKLLYTLHWILLDAAAECADQERERERQAAASRSGPPATPASLPTTEPYLFPVTSLQVFVYLFAPLLPHLRTSDFTSFRLENGLKIWQPLWEYRQPDIPCFTHPAKPTRAINTQPDEPAQATTDIGDIYVGTQQDVGFLLDEPERGAEEAVAAQEAKDRAQLSRSATGRPGLQAPLVHMSEICTLTTLETPVTPQLEMICEYCNTKVQPAEKDVFRCKCGHRRRRPQPQPLPLVAQTSLPAPPTSPPLQAPSSVRSPDSPVDKDILHSKFEQAIAAQITDGRVRPRDISAATFFDVAVMRCLYVPPWSEEGMFWALRYFLHRIIEIRDYLQRTSTTRQRSSSVPSITSGAKSAHQSPKHEGRSASPTSRSMLRADLQIPLERRGSKRRRGPLGGIDERPRFVIGGQAASTPSTMSPGVRKLQDRLFTFGVDDIERSQRTTGSPGSSNPVTPREKSFRHKGKSFPRITITTENSPSRASVIEEDLSQHDRLRMEVELESGLIGLTGGEPSTPGTSFGLPRSKTDSNIAYPLPEYQEARGTSNLIQDDGELNYQALIRAVLVALNERPSQRICDVALSLIDVLLDLLLDVKTLAGAAAGPEPDFPEVELMTLRARSVSQPGLPPTERPASAAPPIVLHDVATHRLLMSCITKIFVIIGCVHGCGTETSVSSRGNPSDFMRRQAYAIFHRLQTVNEPEAKRFFKGILTKQELRHVVDFCHAFFGSCVSHAAQDHTRHSKQTRKCLSWVAAQAAKPLVNQLITKADQLRKSENLGLQNDLRLLLTYIKDAHEHIFRRIVLSGVMESQQRQTAVRSRPVTPTPQHTASSLTVTNRKSLLRYPRLEPGDPEHHPTAETDAEQLSAYDDHAATTPSASILRGIFAKRPKVSIKPLRSRESSETNLKIGNSIRSPRVSISEDESVVAPHSPRGKKKRTIRQKWLKSPMSSVGSKDSKEAGTGMHRSVSLVSAEGGSLAGDALRQTSFESGAAHVNTKPRLSFKANSSGNMNLSLLKSKRQESSSAEDDSPRSRAVLRKAGSRSYGDETVTNASSKLVFLLNTNALLTGMKSLGSLLEFCPPGTVPEPSVLAAMLDLQAPVLSRACFLLECAQFVHRCNQGKWPEWMKLNIPQYRQSGPVGRLIAAPTPRKQNILQRTAGKVFYEWARSLMLRLDDIIKTENVDPMTVVSPDTVVVEDEDFFFLGADTDQPSPTCPFVLKMVACQLLMEITAFLRETYRMLPRQKYSTIRGHLKSTAGEKRLASRRWSSVASTSGGTSHQSIQSFADHGQVLMYQTQGPGERRISFMIADDTMSQRSNSSGDEERRQHLLKSGRDRAKQHAVEGPIGRRSSIRRRKASQELDARRDRTNSIRSRKASSVSERSDVSRSSTEELVTPHEERDGVFGGPEQESTEYSDNLPWMETVINLCGRFSFVCDHKKTCTAYCFFRVMRSCTRLCWALHKVHGGSGPPPPGSIKAPTDEDEMMEVQGQSGSQTPTTPSMSQRKLRIFRKASHYTGQLSRLSKSTTLEKNASLESINRPLRLPHDNTTDSKDPAPPSRPPAELQYYPRAESEPGAMARYLQQHVISLFAAPLAVLAKGVMLMDDKQLERMFPICWELLLVDDEEVASMTAVLCVVCSVKISKFVTDYLRKEMNHEEAEERVDSILKFQALWRYRYQVWIRLEDGAQAIMRVSHALNIDYTLPSPLIGRPYVDCPDAPWLPPTSIKIEEVAISQEEQSKNSNTLVAATQTRRKQLQESMNRALRAQEERNQRERERVKVSMLPVLKMAAIEPVPHQVVDEREIEVDDNGLIADTGTVATHTLTSLPVFPTSLGTAILQLIDLLDDADVDNCGISVCDLAFHTIWEGIVEDAVLFLRYMLEKMSHKEKQALILRKMRKLLAFMPRLPPQAACTIFNHLLGYCMSYVRNPNENNYHGVEAVMSVMWQMIPSVDGVSFKDLKTILRREQCDLLLLTANVPGAKKVIVHGPDLTQIPSQIPVSEDTQFHELLTEALDFFSIPVFDKDAYILCDAKTGRAHHPSGYVRDVYFFRRSYYPQLNLVRSPGVEGFGRLQLQAYHNLFLETQKVMLVQGLFDCAEERSESAAQQQMTLVLDDGLTKIPNFPRKALECDVKFQEGPLGVEYLGIDVMHKYAWLQLASNLLCTLSRPTSEVQLSHADIQMLLSVLNGVLVLHGQDSATLRLGLATCITLAQNMKHLFAATGFLLIMPTILRLYAAHQTNSMLVETIEFACSQFFLLHRNPFLLQMFGSAAGLLELREKDSGIKPLKRRHMKKMLFSLERLARRPSKVGLTGLHHPLDRLDILQQVDVKKPLQPLDFCYQTDMADLTAQNILTSAVSSCIAVIAFDSAESPRGTQMLQVLRTLLNEEVWYDEKPADSARTAKEELHKIIALAGSLKSLIYSCESLTRPFAVPLRSPTMAAEGRSVVMASPSHVGHDLEANRPKIITIHEPAEPANQQAEFSYPRHHLLAIVAHFLTTANQRIRHLSKFLGDLATRPPELLDAKSHVRLAEVAHTLLKVAPYDQEVMAGEGLEHYMLEILPTVDFSLETMKAALQNLLRRIEKTFTKISKASSMRKDTDWNAAAKIIQGLSRTLCTNNLMALMPQLRAITGTCIHLTLGEHAVPAGGIDTILASPSATSLPPALLLTVPPVFRDATIDLTAVYLQAGREYCNLEQLCAQFSDRFLRLVVCFLFPFVLRVGSQLTDLPPMRIEDLRYIVRTLVSLLHPPVKSATATKLTVNQHIVRTNSNMSNPPSIVPTSTQLAVNRHQELSRRVAFLGLKVVVACYEGRLGSEWLRLSKSIQDYAEKGNGGLAFWQFLEYTIVYRTALFVHLAPLALRIIDTAKKEGELELAVQSTIRQALTGSVPGERSNVAVFAQIAHETTALIDEFTLLSHIHPPSRSPTQLAGEEGSQGETEGVYRLADFGRFRYGRRKESVTADRSSSSQGGRRSPPIVIPVLIEKTESNAVDNLPMAQRKRSTLTRQKAQHGEHTGPTRHPSVRKANSSEVPEALEMVQLTRAGKDDNVANNVNSKVITVSVVHSARPPSIKANLPLRTHSVESFNDDEEISLLK